MICPAIFSGTQFLSSTLVHIDCQARTIGAYGYGALADPASPVILALTGLLTIFVSLFGIRLILGHPLLKRDIMGEAIRVGLALTLAMSWPAWRVIGFDLIMDGPAELAQAVGLSSGLPGGNGNIIQRLQNVDDGLVSITMYGTGRLTGGVVGGSDLGDNFQGIAIPDEAGLGWGRIFFLVGTIGPYAITRVGAGLLLALAPLMAGLMLFEFSLGIFIGWLRGLTFAAFGAFALFLVEGVELTLLAPWIADVLAQRSTGAFTPSAPTELVVLTLAFSIVSFGILTVIGWITFYSRALDLRNGSQSIEDKTGAQVGTVGYGQTTLQNHLHEIPSRAAVISDAVALTMRREDSNGMMSRTERDNNDAIGRNNIHALQRESNLPNSEILGSKFRRARHRVSAAGQVRDRAGGDRRA